MARPNAPKSRLEKANKAALSSTPAVTHDLVAGKFTDQDWTGMQENYDEDNFIENIVEEICSCAMDKIYENYLQKQLVPYTVLQAKDALLQIVEWQFLSRDEGEPEAESHPNWIEDDEPAPAVIDSCAQGAVPIRSAKTPIKLSLFDAVDELPEPQEEEEISRECTSKNEDNIEDDQVKENEETSVVIEETVVEDDSIVQEPVQQQKSPVKKKKIKRHFGPLKSPRTKQLTDSLEKSEMLHFINEHYRSLTPKTPDSASYHMPNSCQSTVKLQAGRPPGNRDVLYDQAGNVISISKINPDTIPNHKIKTGFKIVDPQVEAAQARLEAMRTGRNMKVKTSQSRSSHRYEPVVITEKKQGSKSHKDGVSLPPLLMETMEISHGVVVRERNRVRVGPKSNSQISHLDLNVDQNLRPVLPSRTSPSTLSVMDIIGNQPAFIKALPESPLVPRPPPQRV